MHLLTVRYDKNRTESLFSTIIKSVPCNYYRQIGDEACSYIFWGTFELKQTWNVDSYILDHR